MPTWAGLDPGASSAFLAGFGIAEMAGAILFTFLIGFVVMRKLITAAGL